jgi:hypothetical protein
LVDIATEKLKRSKSPDTDQIIATRKDLRQRSFENRALREIFEPKTDEVTGEWRRVHNEELYNLYCTSNIVRVIKSRGLRWVDYEHAWEAVEVHTGVDRET